MARNITTWDPLREVSTMREDMERLFDSMLGRYPREREQALWAPAVDVEETSEAVIVRAELPGMKREDIKVRVAEDTVTISGERKYEAEQKDRTFHRIERAYGSFQRTIVLPVSVQGDKAAASYKSGVLELNLPKAERVKTREITVESKD
ncbi:MAG TPA: Hsp20/alpha crystallin family protein [bacterium]|nr:Hsp20/alpha crystallin family protein [bacterium]